jgi:hypothetical protein
VVGSTPNSIGVVLPTLRTPAAAFGIARARAVLIPSARRDSKDFKTTQVGAAVRVRRSSSTLAVDHGAFVVPRQWDSGAFHDLADSVHRKTVAVCDRRERLAGTVAEEDRCISLSKKRSPLLSQASSHASDVAPLSRIRPSRPRRTDLNSRSRAAVRSCLHYSADVQAIRDTIYGTPAYT